MLHEFKLQEIFSDITTKIEDIIMILNWMSLEFFDMKTFFYYSILIVLTYLLTSIEKFYAARGYSFFCTVNFNFKCDLLFKLF